MQWFSKAAIDASWIWLVLVVLGGAVPACGGQANLDVSNRCTGHTSAAIWGGDINGFVAGQLTRGTLLAIGALEVSGPSTICTGTLIAPRWVLSAAHCRRAERLRFRTGTDGDDVTTAVVRDFPHPTRDVALFELESSSRLSDRGALPIPIFHGAIGEEWVGRNATLGGLGDTETGERGLRRFVVEPVVSVTEHRIAVDGQGARGACLGDSGGPLVANTPGELIGVLSSGSADCRGIDRYEAIDIHVEWIRRTIELASRDACGNLDWQGTCLDGGATWCDGGSIVTEDCRHDEVCGYDVEARGYRCQPPELDPCRGVGRIPECLDDVVVRCQDGVLVHADCRECGQRCARAAGRATCQ